MASGVELVEPPPAEAWRAQGPFRRVAWPHGSGTINGRVGWMEWRGLGVGGRSFPLLFFRLPSVLGFRQWSWGIPRAVTVGAGTVTVRP